MRSVIVIGLAYGDEGKGLATDYFVRETGASLVVRFSGGPQAAHNVIAPDGTHHTFSHVGAGSLSGADTFLSRYMMISPELLFAELSVLASKGFEPRVYIDPGCTVITPFHILRNRALESARRGVPHGSVGLGVGEARRDELDGLAIKAGWLGDKGLVAGMLRRIRDRSADSIPLRAVDCDQLADQWAAWSKGSRILPWRTVAENHQAVVFEGSQGALIDESLGFAPYYSWTDCTFHNARKLLDEIGAAPAIRAGVLRTYSTRHGPGPFVPEDQSMDIPEAHNGIHEWMGEFRQGPFDMVAARYAIRATRPDFIFLTHADRVDPRLATAVVEYSTKIAPGNTEALMTAYGSLLKVDLLKEMPCAVKWVSSGPTSTDVAVHHRRRTEPWAVGYVRTKRGRESREATSR